MVNADLFRKIADRIESDPSCYDQENWMRLEKVIDGGCIFCLAEEILNAENQYSSGRPPQKTAKALGLTEKEAKIIYSRYWKPRPDLTVPQALRMIADGASVSEVSA